jgi:hypothetical protein
LKHEFPWRQFYVPRDRYLPDVVEYLELAFH